MAGTAGRKEEGRGGIAPKPRSASAYRPREEVNSVTCCIALILLMHAGNDNLHLLTFFKRQELRIELGDWEGHRSYAKYDNFRVGSEHMQYKLISLGNYHGDAGQYDMIVDMADVGIVLISICYFNYSIQNNVRTDGRFVIMTLLVYFVKQDLVASYNL